MLFPDLREDCFKISFRLIALTGYGRQQDRTAVSRAGFDEHLVKPVNPNELSWVLLFSPANLEIH